ncbi:MAG: matrixin family metalloprotease [candidate division WWE3 bacterium]|nr:matrixin family metalloprotease [candidate division WWE3 bacterium]
MRKLLLIVLSLTLILAVASQALARSSRAFRLPKSAIKISEDVYYLGKTAQGAEGYAFTYRKGETRTFAKAPKAPACYGFLARGARWKITEPYVTDINDPATETSLETWDSQVSLFNIFDGRDTVYLGVLEADTVSPDDLNELYFGDIAEPNVIGVAIVWGYFYGPPQTRELIEWDVILDDVDFAWGDNDLDKMDYQNILTHELGHAAGLNDQYSSDCSEVTMYGYATYGETKKRDLKPQDITGIRELYR